VVNISLAILRVTRSLPTVNDDLLGGGGDSHQVVVLDMFYGRWKRENRRSAVKRGTELRSAVLSGPGVRVYGDELLQHSCSPNPRFVT
jgi:hypothetical protein